MTVKLPCSVVGLVPAAHSVVAERDVLIALLNFRQRQAPSKQVPALGGVEPVVISLNQIHVLTFDSFAVFLGLFVPMNGKVSKDIQQVSASHPQVDSVDDRAIHFFNRGKWTMT